MKTRFLFLSLTFCALQSFAALPANKRLNAMTDMPTIGCTNFNGGVVDETYKLQQVYNAISNSNLRDSGVIITFPQNLYLINSKAYGCSNITLEGEPGKTFFYYNLSTSIGESEAMILNIGKSKVKYKYMGFLGSHDKLIGAYIQNNSDPNPCDSITVEGCYFGDGAVQNALNFGAVSNDNDYAYWNDHISITYSSFKHLWFTGYRENPDDLTGGLFKFNCRGINLQSSSLRTKILYCEGEDISSDWLFGFGCSKGMQTHRKMGRYYGNWDIAFNDVTRCGMMVELNGNKRGQGVRIHDNNFSYSTRKGGFLISSCMSNKQRICKNNLWNAGRGLIEVGGDNVLIQDNIGVMESPVDSSYQGIMPTPLGAGSNRIHFIELDGHKYKIQGNDFTANKTTNAAYDPAEYDGIMLRQGADSRYEDTTYADIKTNSAGYIDISGNSLSGCNARPLDVTIVPAYYVSWKNNIVVSSTMTGSPFMIWGNNWSFIGNETNLTGCYPSNGEALIRLNDQQKTSPTAIVANNVTWNAAWKTKYWWGGASATNIFK